MRFVSVLIDSVVFFVAFFVVAVIGRMAGGGVGVLLYFVVLFASLAYYIWGWANGGTVGQRVLHLQVVDADSGAPIPLSKSVLRLLGYWVASAVCSVGLIWAFFDSRRQGWHDKIAHTVVVKTA